MESTTNQFLALMLARYNEVIDLPDQFGTPRLLSAAKNDEKDVLKLMMKLGARTTVTDINGNNVLHVATVDIVEEFSFPHELRTKTNKNGIFPFEKALFAQNFELADQLDTPDLQPHYRKWAGQAISENKIKVLDFLLFGQLELDQPLNGSYLIFEAVQRRSLEMVELLLGFGAHWDITISGKITPLVQAVYLNDAEIVKSLTKHGANPGWVTGNLTTPLLIAIEGGFDEAYYGMIEDCSEETLNWVSPQSGQTALTTAFNLKRYDLANDLLNWDADDVHMDIQERSLLHRMVLAEDLRAVKLLLSVCHPECNHEDTNGSTPLIDAIMSGYRAMIKLLVRSRKVDKTMTNRGGKTPLDIADVYVHNLIGAEMVADEVIGAGWKIRLPEKDEEFGKVVDLIYEDIRARVSRQNKKIDIESWINKADVFARAIIAQFELDQL